MGGGAKAIRIMFQLTCHAPSLRYIYVSSSRPPVTSTVSLWTSFRNLTDQLDGHRPLFLLRPCTSLPPKGPRRIALAFQRAKFFDLSYLVLNHRVLLINDRLLILVIIGRHRF